MKWIYKENLQIFLWETQSWSFIRIHINIMKKNCTQHLDAGNVKSVTRYLIVDVVGFPTGYDMLKCWRWRPGLHAWPSGTQPGDVTLLMAVAASEHSPAPGTQEAPLRSLTMCNPYFLSLFTRNSSWQKSNTWRVVCYHTSSPPL